MRIYNPSLGRFLSVDPLTEIYPYWSPYAFAGNSPISCVDLDGEELKRVNRYWEQNKDGSFSIVETEVSIIQGKTVTHPQTGAPSAKTMVVDYYAGNAYYSEFYEEINDNGIKPSAAYDYTTGTTTKLTEDLNYIKNGHSKGKIDNSQMRLAEIVKRDDDAPDAQMGKEDFEAGMYAIFTLRELPAGSGGTKKTGNSKNNTVRKSEEVTFTIKSKGTSVTKELNPNKINFSQRTVSGNVEQYVADMKAGKWDWKKSGPIRIMEIGGKWVTYDNRRLMAAQQAGLKSIPYLVVKPTDIMPGSKITWATAFTKRFNDPRNVKAGGYVPNGGLSSQPKIKND